MKFIYNIGISLCICLPMVWICVYLSGWLAFPLCMPGTLFVLLRCRLNKYEGLVAAICLGFMVDILHFEHILLGFSCLLLSSPMILFQGKSWENIFKYRTFFWTSILNSIMQLLYIMVHLWVCRIPITYLKFYTIPWIISTILAGICGVYFLKLQNKYFSIV